MSGKMELVRRTGHVVLFGHIFIRHLMKALRTKFFVSRPIENYDVTCSTDSHPH